MTYVGRKIDLRFIQEQPENISRVGLQVARCRVFFFHVAEECKQICICKRTEAICRAYGNNVALEHGELSANRVATVSLVDQSVVTAARAECGMRRYGLIDMVNGVKKRRQTGKDRDR